MVILRKIFCVWILFASFHSILPMSQCDLQIKLGDGVDFYEVSVDVFRVLRDALEPIVRVSDTLFETRQARVSYSTKTLFHDAVYQASLIFKRYSDSAVSSARFHVRQSGPCSVTLIKKNGIFYVFRPILINNVSNYDVNVIVQNLITNEIAENFVKAHTWVFIDFAVPVMDFDVLTGNRLMFDIRVWSDCLNHLNRKDTLIAQGFDKNSMYPLIGEFITFVIFERDNELKLNNW